MNGAVLVTPRSLTVTPHPALERITQAGYELRLGPAGEQPDEAALKALLPGCVGWLAGVEPVSAGAIKTADKLRAISRNGVGTDNLPMSELQAREIAVLTADGANAVGVAELAITLMLSALRHVPWTDTGVKAGGWPRRRGREIRGKIVGVVGCGAIGRDVARLVAGLGAQVIGYDPMRPQFAEPPGFRWADIPELLAASDIVTLHCPPPRDGKPLIGREAIATMPRGAILVNTARAGLVDEQALAEALESGHLGSYAADTFAEEPPRSLALAGRADVIATSHIGAFTAESVDRATEVAIDRLLTVLGVIS